MPKEQENGSPVDAESDEQARRWEPPFAGGSFYRTLMEFEGWDPMEFSTTVPSNLKKTDLSTALVNRIGGPSPRDWAFRRQLYFWIGLITVAGGKVEAAMKRALLATEESAVGDFAKVDATWTKLDRDLRRLGEQQIEKPTVAPGWGEAVLGVLDWGVEHRVKERRDSTVHAYWWDWADTNVTRARFFQSGESKTLVGDFEAMKKDGETLLTYADMIESLTGPRWINMHLPRENLEGEEPPRIVSWVRERRIEDD